MHFIALRDAQPGMIIGRDIYDSIGRILVGKDSHLTEYHIERLAHFGYDGLYINDALTEDIEIETTIPPHLRTKGMESIKKRDIDACKAVAQEMVDFMMENGVAAVDVHALGAYDDCTYVHSINVAAVCGTIGMGLGLSNSDMNILILAALLHDLGKMAIPKEVLNKKGRLTPEEYELVKSHSHLSYEMIDRPDISSYVKNAVLSHHENVDGSGYPNNIVGEQQTIFTKILHVADVFDALIARRPYKEPFSPAEVCDYLTGGSGILFDPAIVDTLLHYVPLYPKGSDVVLSNEQTAIVYDNFGEHNLRPIVRLMNGNLLDLVKRTDLELTLKAFTRDEDFDAKKNEAERRKMLGLPEEEDISLEEPKRILVVDDMITNLQYLRGLLENTYEVILVKSAEQAISYLDSHVAPDLILMDIDMPGMDGITCARHIIKTYPSPIPILFVTSLCDRDTVMACMALKAAGYIRRPYKPVYIKEEIKRIFDERFRY